MSLPIRKDVWVETKWPPLEKADIAEKILLGWRILHKHFDTWSKSTAIAIADINYTIDICLNSAYLLLPLPPEFKDNEMRFRVRDASQDFAFENGRIVAITAVGEYVLSMIKEIEIEYELTH